MYDALVALRTGWGSGEFATASPDLMLAMRASIYAERMAPLLDQFESVMATDPASVPPERRVDVNKARITASTHLATLRKALYLDDSDG